MAKPTNDSLFLQERLVLTREISGEDFPIWKGLFPSELSKRDDLYNLGANLIVWSYDEKEKNYYPGIVDPIDPNNSMTHYKEIRFNSPSSVIFVFGRQIDLLIEPFYIESTSRLNNNEFAGFVIHFIKNGIIYKKETITLKDIQLSHRFSKNNVRLYQDKFLVFVNAKNLFVVNMATGNQVKKIEDVPTDGALILDRNDAIIWSRVDSKRAIVNLETGDKTSFGLEQIDPDMEIIGFSAGNLLVGNTERIKFYNEWGAVILKRDINQRVTEKFDGVVDHFGSTNIAFVLRENQVGRVYTCKDGYLLEHDIGKIATRSLLLYEGLVYVARSYRCLDLWVVTHLSEDVVDRSVADHPINRYMRVSPVSGWILELQTDLRGDKIVAVRSPACRPISLPVPIKLQWPEYSPDHCIIPPFIFRNQHGQVRIWTGEEYKTAIGTKEVKLTLYEWDVMLETLGRKIKEIMSIPVTEKVTFCRWFRTDQWITLTIGRTAYVFEHEGSRISQKIHLESKYDFNIKNIRGFGNSLWFLGGQTQELEDVSTGKKTFVERIKEVFYWDGVDQISRVELDPGIDMLGACATGVRNSKNPNSLFRAELIISSKDVRGSWFKLCFMKDGKGITYTNHFGVLETGTLTYRDNLLCETPDKDGRVFFSEGRSISVYLPWLLEIKKKADLDYIHANQKDALFTTILDGDHVCSLAVGTRYLWVACETTYYCLSLATLNDTDIQEKNQPIKPVRFYDEKRPRAEFQPPNIIRPYLNNVEDLDDQAIFENEEFIWLSDLPLNLYKRPDMLNLKNLIFAVTTDKGKMLVLASYFGKSADGGKITIRSALCEVLL
jgi:hypothetical protein